VNTFFPEISMTGPGANLTLWLDEDADEEKYLVHLDSGWSSVVIAEVATFEETTEVVNVIMTCFAALGYSLDESF
jgi:hypothetical protein